jgi:ketosteroid isomerase-like protein
MPVRRKLISMKTLSLILGLPVTLFLLSAFVSSPDENKDTTPTSLYDSIAAMDAMWEDAYNNCKMDVMEDIISEDLEFYHDQGGLMTSKKKLNEALKANICGKVTRELKKGSLEVYPIKGYGAVEMGLHGFHNSKEPGAQMHYSKFVHIWKSEKGKWRITRVISLH